MKVCSAIKQKYIEMDQRTRKNLDPVFFGALSLGVSFVPLGDLEMKIIGITLIALSVLAMIYFGWAVWGIEGKSHIRDICYRLLTASMFSGVGLMARYGGSGSCWFLTGVALAVFGFIGVVRLSTSDKNGSEKATKCEGSSKS